MSDFTADAGGYSAPVAIAPPAVLPALGNHARQQRLDGLAAQLAELQAWLADDLQAVEEALRTPAGTTLAERAGRHLLQAGGKRIRPLCTLLSGRIGGTASARSVRDLAIAVELVHNATLLHDDVVDLADTRRGKPTARALHGNEVSIFAGDWVLVAALRRIVGAGFPGLVDSALDTLDAMIAAEVEQSQRARTLAADVEGYLRVAEGKTASLFRWAMCAGATAAGLDSESRLALQTFGGELGLAFQITDDAIDLDGDPATTGKALFADLCEGKVTLPVALALERRPALHDQLIQLRTAMTDPHAGQFVQNDEGAATAALCAGIARAVADCGALEAARMEARTRCDRALAALQVVRPCPEREALRAVADALVRRRA